MTSNVVPGFKSYSFRLTIVKEKKYWLFLSFLFVIAFFVYPYPDIARWFAFCLAAYSVIANDSLQTIGTFIASNGRQQWWKLWLFIGTLFLLTVTISWLAWDGDVTYQRLASKGFENTPSSFGFLQVAAPIFLLIVTRLRMPVSTTFLLLSSFTTSSHAIGDVLLKSLCGYALAFIVSFLLWRELSGFIRKLLKGKAVHAWMVAQWITSGILWCIWIMQDAANIAVYLPRSLNLNEFLFFAGFIFFGLAIIFYLRGDKIQQVINEKTKVSDVRAATMIDLVYAIILIIFQWISTIPMSTTWVFLGLLAGRELGITIAERKNRFPRTLQLIRKDLVHAVIGLIISIIIALLVNPHVQKELSVIINYFMQTIEILSN